MKWLEEWYKKNRNELEISEEEDCVHLRIISVLFGLGIICAVVSILFYFDWVILPILIVALIGYGIACWIYRIDHGYYPWSKKVL